MITWIHTLDSGPSRNNVQVILAPCKRFGFVKVGGIVENYCANLKSLTI